MADVTTSSVRPVSLGAAVRHQEICKALASAGRVSISELTDQLEVTSVTIREDLKFLEEQGLLVRTRGGALAKPDKRIESALEQTSMTNRAEKQAIARYGAALVQSGQTVMIDVGSTTTELAHALSTDLNGVTVITNGLNIALSLERAPGISVIVTGGTLRSLQHSLVAPMATLLLSKLQADVAFIGCNGVDRVRGFTNANIAEAEIKQAMLESADYSIFLADHEKIGSVSSAFVADIDSADLLVTDSGADPETLESFQDSGLEVKVVEVASRD
jgi:DeoR/GlpR family transcriptional regulator of sugar metabolism